MTYDYTDRCISCQYITSTKEMLKGYCVPCSIKRMSSEQ